MKTLTETMARTSSDMGGGRDMAAMFGGALQAYQPNYTPGLLLVTLGVALFLVWRPLVHAILAGVEERASRQSDIRTASGES